MRQFRLELRNRFEILQRKEPDDDETDQPEADLEKAIGILENKAYNMTAKKVLRYKAKKVKPWISKESWYLIEQRKAIKLKLEKVPLEWKRGLLIKIPKKGNLRERTNWRGVTLLPIVSKILGKIVIDRIRMGIDHRLRKEQAGCRSGRRTTEQIFILRNILEQVNEWQATLYINFVDFEKAFDSVHKKGLWLDQHS